MERVNTSLVTYTFDSLILKPAGRILRGFYPKLNIYELLKNEKAILAPGGWLIKLLSNLPIIFRLLNLKNQSY